MKILKPGKQWWINEIVTCSYCGQQVQIEIDDDKLVNTFEVNSQLFKFQCNNCKEIILLNRVVDKGPNNFPDFLINSKFSKFNPNSF